MQLASAVESRDARGEACALVARTGEDHRMHAERIAKSRLAVSQSFAVRARVPELSFVGQFLCVPGGEISRPGPEDAIDWSPRLWVGLEAGSRLRFFFDVDDGEVLRRDEVGVMLASEDDVPRETKSILFDLAQAAIPEGHPRLFTAHVRNSDGEPVYRGSIKMTPLPVKKIDRRT